MNNINVNGHAETSKVNPIVQLLHDAMQRHIGPKPIFYISGGIDSAICLHHGALLFKDPIHTATFGFEEDDDEFAYARKVAEFYGTEHHEVRISSLLGRYEEILRYCERPRFNLWVYWLAELASKLKRVNCYCGEGLDEHFGGYWNKPFKTYLELWADHVIWIRPTYEMVHKAFALTIHIPYSYDTLNFQRTLPYYDWNHEKAQLREAYKGVVPDFIVAKRKQRGGVPWREVWNRELSRIYPDEKPENDDEIRALLNRWVSEKWVEVHKKKATDKLE